MGSVELHLAIQTPCKLYEMMRKSFGTNFFQILTEQNIQVKKSPKGAGGSFQKHDVDVLENIRFEDEYKDKEAESLTELYEVKVEQGKEGDKKDEYEILSIYSCNECVMHEGSSNKVQF